MAEKSFFFTAVSGSPAYSADDFTAWMYDRLFRKDGVLNGLDNSLAVSSDGNGNALVDTGCATKTGHGYKNDSVLTKALTLPTAGYTNVNSLVVRVDSSPSPNTMHVVVLVGTNVPIGNTPIVPSITNGTDIYLADIQCTNIAGSYSYTVTDKRVYAPLFICDTTLGTNWLSAISNSLGQRWEGAFVDNFKGIPTRVVLTLGSGTWTVPAGVTQIRYTGCGGGGGGGAGASSTWSGTDGGSGGNTTFGTTTWIGGSGGYGARSDPSTAGMGGWSINQGGSAGSPGSYTCGGCGGGSGGWGGGGGSLNGESGKIGGGGGGGGGVLRYGGGGGGGTHLSAETMISMNVTPGQVIPYTVGGGGAQGDGNAQGGNGGTGGNGIIIIEY